MSNERKAVTCSHCLEVGHNKASSKCPRKGLEAAPRPEKEVASNKWTSEKEKLLLSTVKDGQIKTDWEKVSEIVGHTASSCKHRYFEIVTPTENVNALVKRLTLDDIILEMSENRNECMTCKAVLYIPLLEWRGVSECPACHKAHCDEQDALWNSIEPFSKCNFCNRGRCDGIPLHFDHLNMFEKGDSICTMIHRGDPIEKIIDEVSKCQVLCKSCHNVVTKVERLVGFHKAKGQLTRSINGTLKDGETIDPEKVAELQLQYRELYKETIEPLYPFIKQLIHTQKDS